MREPIRIRLLIFLAIIAVILGSIGAAGYKSYKTFDQFHDGLAHVHIESFRLADHLQQSFLELNTSLVRYGLLAEDKDADEFRKQSQALEDWIEQQKSPLQTPLEKTLLDELAARFRSYLASAENYLQLRARANATNTIHDLGRLQASSEELLNISYRLASAHQNSLSAFLDAAKDSERFFGHLIYAALVVLILVGAAVAFVVYRDMIAPLRHKLVESQKIIDRQEKLAALGMLAAGIAHEIRNPLTAIKARLFTLQMQLARKTPSFEDSEVISQEIGRLERIVKDFLQFARPSDPRFAVISAAQPLFEVHNLLGPQLRRKEIQLRLEAETPAFIRVDPEQLKQVLINLIQNAAESIEQNGIVTLRLATELSKNRSAPAKIVLLEVEDTGKGIPPEVQKRLFDPFFSTKETGTGLGLSIALRIVEKNQGTLRYRTQVNHGTTFGIVLPAVEHEPST